MFATSIVPFLTEGWGRGAYQGGTNTTSITLPDLFERLIPGGSSGMVNLKYPNITDSIKTNLGNNGAMMVAQVIGIPILFSVANKVLRKSVILPANRLLANTGLDVKMG
tara:strand:+ start:132 stop:458 length:327 start_codon:yes stop_codon:yes gene_type:complete